MHASTPNSEQALSGRFLSMGARERVHACVLLGRGGMTGKRAHCKGSRARVVCATSRPTAPGPRRAGCRRASCSQPTPNPSAPQGEGHPWRVRPARATRPAAPEQPRYIITLRQAPAAACRPCCSRHSRLPARPHRRHSRRCCKHRRRRRRHPPRAHSLGRTRRLRSPSGRTRRATAAACRQWAPQSCRPWSCLWRAPHASPRPQPRQRRARPKGRQPQLRAHGMPRGSPRLRVRRRPHARLQSCPAPAAARQAAPPGRRRAPACARWPPR